jgi:hypothetical protein
VHVHTQADNRSKGIAYKAARALIFAPTDEVAGEGHSSEDAEMMHRVFWATWMGTCVNSDHCLPGTQADHQVLSVPLPVTEIAFQYGIAESRHKLSSPRKPAVGDDVDDGKHPISSMAESMRVILLW